MRVSSVYPVLITDTVADTADFYRSHFGFEDTFASDWYVSLRHGQPRPKRSPSCGSDTLRSRMAIARGARDW